MFCIPKILKNESNSQQTATFTKESYSCFVSQRYWKMKAIHNKELALLHLLHVVLYPKDTEKWKQFTTSNDITPTQSVLFCIPKILKNESNSQLGLPWCEALHRCFVSQRYWKMKAIHNPRNHYIYLQLVVLYPKDTEKWKQFTTKITFIRNLLKLFCIPKILKNESNSQHWTLLKSWTRSCFVSQRYWKMKAIHNKLYNIH